MRFNKLKEKRFTAAIRIIVAGLVSFALIAVAALLTDRLSQKHIDHISDRHPITVSTLPPPAVINAPEKSLLPKYGINVRSFGALGNGKHDDSAAIQEAIDKAALSKIKTVIVPAGTYRVTTALALRDNINLIGAGRSLSILKMDAQKQDLIEVGEASNTEVAHLQVRDIYNPGDDESWGIVVTSGKNNTIEDVRVLNSDDAGIRIGYSHNTNSRNCRVLNCEVENTREGSGIEIIRAENVIVSGNKVIGSSQHGIRLCGAIKARVTGNYLRENANGISIQGFTSKNGPDQNVTGFYVAGNECDNNKDSGINIFNQATGGIIKNNTITSDGKYDSYGIFAYTPDADGNGNQDISIAQNTIEGVARGINLCGANYKLYITDNRILNWSVDNGSAYGIYVDARSKGADAFQPMRAIHIEHNYLTNRYRNDGYGIHAYNLTDYSQVFVRFNTILMPEARGKFIGFDNGESIISTLNGRETNKMKTLS